MIKLRKTRWARHVANMGRKRNIHKVLVEKSERKIPLGRPRSKCEDNIKIELKGIGWQGTDWIHLDQDRDQGQAPVNTILSFWAP
jgi:hypothetical protein